MPEKAAHAEAQQSARKGLASEYLSSKAVVIYNMPPRMPIILMLETMGLPLPDTYEPFCHVQLGYIAKFYSEHAARKVVTDLNGLMVQGNRLHVEFREVDIAPPPSTGGEIMRQIKTNRVTVKASRSTSNPQKKCDSRNGAAAGSVPARKLTSSRNILQASNKHRTIGSPESTSEEEEFLGDPAGKSNPWQIKSLDQEDKMFICYTISEDRTGTQEDFVSSRLAAFNARCERKTGILQDDLNEPVAESDGCDIVTPPLRYVSSLYPV